MQEEVENAWLAWQQEVLEQGTRSWEAVGEKQPTLPRLNRQLIGCTEAKHPGKDDRWQYEMCIPPAPPAAVASAAAAGAA